MATTPPGDSPLSGSPLSGREQRALMPGTAPEPALRRPVHDGHYMSNRYEREYASLAEQLAALEDDIRRARRADRRARRGVRRMPRARVEPPAPPHGERATLADGTPVLIRPIEPDDAPQLQDGFKKLAAVSRYQRFLTSVDYLDERQLGFLTHVDHVRHEALVVSHAVSGEGIGVARFIRDESDPTRADVAIVVAEGWRGRGAGRLLADRLAARARAVGIESFEARMLAGNRPARRLVERVGVGIHTHEDGGTIVLTARPRREGPRLTEPLPAAARRRSLRRLLAAAYRRARPARFTHAAHERPRA